MVKIFPNILYLLNLILQVQLVYGGFFMKVKLWTKNFSLLIAASALGSAGSIAGGFALSFFIFDETGSPFAAALVMAIQSIPYLFIPFIIAPIMDRLSRKKFLVIGDMLNGLIYIAMGLWVMYAKLPYIAYMILSFLLAILNSVDQLAFTSIFPDLIPKGAEQKGYSVSSTLYPVLRIIMMPLAAVLLDILGVAVLLLIQGAFSILASFTENCIKISESENKRQSYSFEVWKADIREAVTYLKKEKGLRSIFSYMAVTNGVAEGYYPIMVAFFRSTPGFSAAMYSLFSVVEFMGRSIGGAFQYRVEIPKKKKFYFTFFVYQTYELMDMCLLWISYPLMLVNRGICGFLGSNSAIIRSSAVQVYIPSNLRARVNAFNNMFITFSSSIFSLLIGFLGELIDYRWCITICGTIAMFFVWAIIWTNRESVKKVYES